MGSQRTAARVLSGALAVCLVGVAGLALASPASAHDIVYGWLGCSYDSKIAQDGDLEVGHVNLPADSTNGGYLNSFTGRLSDAVSRMDAAVSANTGSGNGLRWVGKTSSANPAYIAVKYENPQRPGPSRNYGPQLDLQTRAHAASRSGLRNDVHPPQCPRRLVHARRLPACGVGELHIPDLLLHL
ncbi:hypothetical protein CCO02nite_17600 [Cellulomonas composti]|uniref:Uncharacterized protein n=1 Tax=Cellulomonas composti TaxID=266130 RepID=A0A511JAT8_9CELL|nr:hypothetical protein CCO02nite_17600 [Cellulomonas composti]